VLRPFAKRVVQRAGRSRLGRNVVHATVVGDPRDARFSTVRAWPERIEGFEDFVFLFSSNQLNHGIISQELDEAALLYRLVRGRQNSTIVEIGRFKGGSTFLIAAGIGEGSHVWSYDIHVAHDATFSGEDLDRELRQALERYGLTDRVDLIVADSRTAEPPPALVDVLLVDGDHSYEGVSADWRHWRSRLAPGGHVLFHDAVDYGGFGTYVEGVGRLVAELDRDPSLERRPNAGGIAHFVKLS
jgi:predicted O-methyltransferase YrrM